MKLQYLGDSRDSFKWHYHDYLMNNNSRARSFGYIPMLRPDNGTSEGSTNSHNYESSDEIQEFCGLLRMNRDIHSITLLPKYTGSNYRVEIHNPSTYYSLNSSDKYFKGPLYTNICLVDPCTGFEPANPNNNHIKYRDIAYYINTLPKRAVFSIYQHFRRKNFAEDYIDSSRKLKSLHPHLHSCAIYWRSDVMFIQTSVSKDEIALVHSINQKYASMNKDIKTII